MKFAEIKIELETKQKVIYNTIDHLKFEINKLSDKLDELNQDYNYIDNMLIALDNLSMSAE